MKMTESGDLHGDSQTTSRSVEDLDAEVERMMLLATAVAADVVKAQSWCTSENFEVSPRVVVVESIYRENVVADTWRDSR